MNYYLIFIVTLSIIIVLFTIKRNNICENTIWSYWDQGKEEMCSFYKMCIKTWRKKNPNHKIIILDKYNVYKYIDKKDLPPNWEKIERIQHKSDFVRLALLEKYGGIWMDISTICLKPINSVFQQKKSLEGFAIRKFDSNHGLSIFENWFITGKKGSIIIKRWKEELLKAFGNATSMEDINKEYFQGVDLQKIEYGWYLSMHRVMMKLNQLDTEIKYLYYNDSKILGAEETAFLQYDYFGWDGQEYKLLENNDEFINKVKESNTPILKFTNSGGTLRDLDDNKIKNMKDSVIYKLFHF